MLDSVDKRILPHAHVQVRVGQPLDGLIDGRHGSYKNKPSKWATISS